MNMQKIVDMLFPVLLAAVGWLLAETGSLGRALNLAGYFVCTGREGSRTIIVEPKICWLCDY